MISLQVTDLSKSFGINEVLKNITFSLQMGDRAGIVGVNGCGKTTLMRILAELDTADHGSIAISKGLRIGYLAQQDTLQESGTIWEELTSVFDPVFKMEERLRQLESEIAEKHEDPAAFETLSNQYDRLTAAYEEAGGYSWRSQITGVLNGLGFKPEQYDYPLDTLSGGERTRFTLARLLLLKPDLLMLDEPTNHLDMDTLNWLENYLTAYRGTVLVISHDRYFLDHVCNTIVEIVSGRSEQYRGNYTAFMRQRMERLETRMRAYELQQKEIERQEAIIARYRMYNREKSIRAAESREKALDRMERLEKPVEDKAIRFQFAPRRRTGEDVLMVEGLSKSFEHKTLFDGFSLHVRAGEHVAIIGPNGIGKTTLIRMLLGELSRDAGTISFGANVDIGYYDQHQSTLNPDKTVLDEVWDRFPAMEQSDVRGALGMFLFTGDDVFQPIRTLSGGERGRVALTILMLRHDNVLLLDEPTTHLDMDSREVLENALADFGGTIITVSHDRYFINRIADRIIEMQPDGITMYLGNYDEYLEKKNAPKEVVAETGKTRTMVEKEKRREKLNRQQEKQLRATRNAAEAAVMDKEAEIADLEARMSDADLYLNPEMARTVQAQYQAAKEELDALYRRWEEAEAALGEQ
ncbi:MAG: ABC-F family ATP-binding cassette domain-containing protein [Clostridia bacterium]|nr:ABC-F family ATP-binding cassette domain-containing protein [Clostridia bacterium]